MVNTTLFFILFKVSDVVSTFCLILEFPHRTNHCVRADCIQTLIQLGYPPELICKLTGEIVENVTHHISRSLIKKIQAIKTLEV